VFLGSNLNVVHRCLLVVFHGFCCSLRLPFYLSLIIISIKTPTYHIYRHLFIIPLIHDTCNIVEFMICSKWKKNKIKLILFIYLLNSVIVRISCKQGSWVRTSILELSISRVQSVSDKRSSNR
jgi:hypothetical protein